MLACIYYALFNLATCSGVILDCLTLLNSIDHLVQANSNCLITCSVPACSLAIFKTNSLVLALIDLVNFLTLATNELSLLAVSSLLRSVDLSCK